MSVTESKPWNPNQRMVIPPCPAGCTCRGLQPANGWPLAQPTTQGASK